MKTDSISRRLAALEAQASNIGKGELVQFSFQWLKEDGMPIGDPIKRMVTKDSFGWLK